MIFTLSPVIQAAAVTQEAALVLPGYFCFAFLGTTYPAPQGENGREEDVYHLIDQERTNSNLIRTNSNVI